MDPYLAVVLKVLLGLSLSQLAILGIIMYRLGRLESSTCGNTHRINQLEKGGKNHE